MDSKIGFGRTVDMSFEQAVERVTQELQKEGFGVLTEIDLAATFKETLDVDSPPYRILGACNSQPVHRAVQAARGVGLPPPCKMDRAWTVRARCASSSWTPMRCFSRSMRPRSGGNTMSSGLNAGSVAGTSESCEDFEHAAGGLV